MPRTFTEDEAIAAVARLSRTRLTAYLAAEAVRPHPVPRVPATPMPTSRGWSCCAT